MTDKISIGRCKEYIEGLLERSVSESLKFDPLKPTIEIIDVDIFHQTAERSGSWIRFPGKTSSYPPWYILKVPNGTADGRDFGWCVTLPMNLTNEFLTKYGGQRAVA